MAALTNTNTFVQQLERSCPPTLKDAGIGRTVILYVFITENGSVEIVRVQQSSGYPQLDEVAEQLMREVARFSPTLNRNQPVPAWMQIPNTFETLRSR